MPFQICKTFFILWSTKEDILKNVRSQTNLVTIDFYCMDSKKKKKDIAQNS